MTDFEFNKLAVSMQGIYMKETLFPSDHSMEIWYQLLKDIPYETADMALKKWATTEKWSPTIADLRRLSFEVSNPEIPTWDEAWETVLQAVRTYGYTRRIEAMDTFDEITRKTVARVGWNQICLSEQIGIERSAFQKIYTALADKTKEMGQIAPAVKKALQATRDAHNQLLADKLNKANLFEEKPPEKEFVELDANTQKKLDDLRTRLRGVG